MTREVRLGRPPPGPSFYLAEGRGREPLGLSRRYRRILIGGCLMQKINIVYWQEEDGWLGYLQEYPDYYSSIRAFFFLSISLPLSSKQNVNTCEHQI